MTKIRTEDWRDYFSLEGLANQSGVAKEYHKGLLVKELVDNAIDAEEEEKKESKQVTVSLGSIRGHRFYIEDRGPGIDGDEKDIAHLFSVARETLSTKGERYPRRGAMGRGLRFCMGAVFCYATDGVLKVSTRGRTLLLKPDPDKGSTRVERIGEYNGSGTRIVVEFPDPISEADLLWGRLAIQMAQAQGKSYNGYSSPWWYDTLSFYKLLESIEYDGERKVIQYLREMFGGRYALKDLDNRVQGLLNQKSVDGFSIKNARFLLEELRRVLPKDIKPSKLGYVGELKGFRYHHKVDGNYEYVVENREKETLEIPYVAELWARPATPEELNKDRKGTVTVFVNKTPVAIPPVDVKKDDVYSDNINLFARFDALNKNVSFYLNIITPFLERTGNAKIPKIPDDLNSAIWRLFQKAVRKINRDKSFGGLERPKGVTMAGLSDSRVKEIQKEALQGIKALFQKEGLTDIKYLNVLSDDPFMAGRTPASAAMAVWFEDIWVNLNPDGKIIHLRRLHYQIVSQTKAVKKHDGKPYDNNYNCWQYLLHASKYARELRLIDPLLIIDRRNPVPYGRFITSFELRKEIDFPHWYIPEVDLATLRVEEFLMPGLQIDEQMAYEYASALQPVHLEIWTEKATMNDILEEICKSYGIILVQNTGYASITSIERLFKERAMQLDKPSVILYISDFDEAGENMPVMVSRTLQHRIIELKGREGLLHEGREIAVHPIILTKEQMQSKKFAKLPKAPAKKGVGKVTELDALEAVMPGKFREIVEENIQKFLDRKIIDNMPTSIESAKRKYQETLQSRVSHLVTEANEIRQSLKEITEKYKPDLQVISGALQREILPYQKKLTTIREVVAGYAEEALKEAKMDIASEKQPSLDDTLFLSSRPFKDQTERLLKHCTFKKEKKGHHGSRILEDILTREEDE